jgi:hypothetical protein
MIFIEEHGKTFNLDIHKVKIYFLRNIIEKKNHRQLKKNVKNAYFDEYFIKFMLFTNGIDFSLVFDQSSTKHHLFV